MRDDLEMGISYPFQDVARTVFSLSKEQLINLTRYPENQGYVYFKFPFYKALMKAFRKDNLEVLPDDDVFPKTTTLFKKYQSKKSLFINDFNLNSVKCNMYRMLFLEHCYDIDSATKLNSIIVNYYKISHYSDSTRHNIDHTKIFSDSIFEQACFLMDGLFDIHIEATKDNNVKRKLCLVFGKVLVFYGVMLIIEQIGLYPFRDSVPWTTSNRIPPEHYDLFSFLIFCKEHPAGASDYEKTTHSQFTALLSVDTFPYKYDLFIKTEYAFRLISWCHEMLRTYEKDYFKVLLFVDEDEDYINVEEKDVVLVLDDAEDVGKKKRKASSSNNSSPSKRNRGDTNKKTTLTKKKKSKKKNPAKSRMAKSATPNYLLKAAKSDLFCMDCQKKGNRWKAIATILDMKKKSERYLCKHHATLLWFKLRADGEIKDTTNGNGLLTYADMIYIDTTTDPDVLFPNILGTSEASPCKSGRCEENRSMAVECPTNCSSGSSCSNQLLRKLRNTKQSDLFVPEPISLEKGVGLFAKQKFKKGDLIVEYVGVLRRSEDCSKILDEKISVGDSGIYFMKLCNGYTIDAEVYGNDSRYINHSCNPNSAAKKWMVSIMSYW